jgi:phage head maturation protease
MIPLYIFAEKLLDMKPKTFVLSDESINSYGFRVLTAGIALDRFERNPIMLWNHTRSVRDDRETMLPIGKWANIRVEDGRLIADAVFDEKDKFAMKIAEKVEQGIINMASIGFVVNEESDKPEVVLPGQTLKTVTKCTLLEVSIVDIGSNANAVALYDKEGNIMELSAGGQCAVGLINNSKNTSMDVKEIAKILGLKEDATEAEIKEKLNALNREQKDEAANSRIGELEGKLRQLEAEKAAQEKKAITTLVDDAVKAGKITIDKKQHFVELGIKVGIDSLTETLSCMNPALRPTDVIGHHPTPGQKKFSEMGEDELRALRDNDRTAYCELYRREFGIEPEFK